MILDRSPWLTELLKCMVKGKEERNNKESKLFMKNKWVPILELY